jgi:RHS repeat-associated protein
MDEPRFGRNTTGTVWDDHLDLVATNGDLHGVTDLYARDYDTATGSWVQPDEWRGMLVRPQSLNRYAYIENTPVSFSDHLGYAIKAMNMSGGGKAFAKRVTVRC